MTQPEPPIQNLDVFDIVGRRNDGGIDLVVVCSGPLDESQDTLSRIEKKIKNYLLEVRSESFRQQFSGSPVTIFLSCEHSISEAAMAVISALSLQAQSEGVGVRVVEGMAQQAAQRDVPASGRAAR